MIHFSYIHLQQNLKVYEKHEMHLSDDHRLWPPPSLVLMLPPPVSRSVSPVLQLPQVSQPHPLIHLEKNEFMDKIINGVAEDQL